MGAKVIVEVLDQMRKHCNERRCSKVVLGGRIVTCPLLGRAFCEILRDRKYSEETFEKFLGESNDDNV